MTPKSIRNLCYLFTTLAVAGSVWAIHMARTQPYDLASSRTDVKPVREQAQSEAPALTSLDAYEPLWDLDLQRPLYDPPPPKIVTPPPPPPPPLTIKLLGTFIEADGSKAMVISKDGSMDLVSVGQTIGEAVVKAIDPSSITVEYYGQQRILEVQSN